MKKLLGSRRLSFLSACLLMLIVVSVAQAGDSPSPYLKGVTAVAYIGAMKDEGRCKIDWKAWNTAIDFVANQSTKLKLMTLVEHNRQIDELNNRDKETDPTLTKNSATWTEEDVRKHYEASERFEKHLYMPTLFITITTIELEIGCVAVIEAEVNATLKRSAIIATGASVPNPRFSIWSKTSTLKSSYQSFSRLAIETSERIMKEFVNDWTGSQNLPY